MRVLFKTFVAMIAFAFSATLFADEQATTYELDIQAQGLPSALKSFAEQTDLQVVYFAAVAEGKEAPAIEGEYTADAALDQLLANADLEYQNVDARTYSIAPEAVADKGGASDSKNLSTGPTPVLMAQNQTSSTTSTEIRSRSSDGGTSIVMGRVTDLRTGANLKGAKVTIEETGLWTSTNDLGEFRFASVPTGSATITVSFLGYAGQSATVGVGDGPVAHNFALRGGSEIEEIVVFGQRSARALALNQERTAENFTTVLSADLLGQFDGATLADTLRRVPGVAFQQDPLTGDGTNVIIRGLAPDLNQTRIDGIRLAEGSGRGRSPDIGNILTETINQVTISKTLLPSQDSSGSGGLVEIETVGPLDRDRRHVRLSFENVFDNDFRRSIQGSGLVSATFGDEEEFGITASLQYRESDYQTVAYSTAIDAFGEYLPIDGNGDPIQSPFALDPRRAFPYESGVSDVFPGNVSSSLNDVNTETTSGTLAIQWRPFENTDWRVQYTRAELTTQTTRTAASFGPFSRYIVQPILELGGEERAAVQWEDAAEPFGFPGFFVSMSHTAAGGETNETSDILSFRGLTTSGDWTFKYSVGRSTAQNDNESFSWAYRTVPELGLLNELPLEFISETAFDNQVNGNVVSPFRPISDDQLPIPLLSPEGFAFFNDPANYFLPTSFGDRIDVGSTAGENERTMGGFSVRKEFDNNALRYLEFGGEYESVRFDVNLGDSFAFVANGGDRTLADLGFTTFTGNNLSAIGQTGGFFGLSQPEVRAFIRDINQFTVGDDALLARSLVDNTAFQDNGTYTDEDELALYIQGRVDIDKFEIIGGVRFSSYDISARSLASSTLTLDNGQPDLEFNESSRELVDQEADQSEFLPRLLVNYRPSENIVLRGGYFRSIARPRISDLGRRQTVSLDLRQQYGPAGDQPRLTIQSGNPGLEPTITDSYDLSLEVYDDSAGVLGLSLFFKDISNFVEFTSSTTSGSIDGIVLPDDSRFQNLPDNILVVRTQPGNNDQAAEIWGVEINIQRQFVELPGAWSGLGVIANYTYTDSEKYFVFEDVFDPVLNEFVDVEVNGVRFNQSPEHSGTIALTYNQAGFDGSIAYSAQSDRLSSFQGNGLSRFDSSVSTLDARLEYRWQRDRGRYSVFMTASDLLNGNDDPNILTYRGNEIHTGGTYLGGRTVSLGLVATF